MKIYSSRTNENISRFLGKPLWVKIHSNRWCTSKDYYVKLRSKAQYPDRDDEDTYFCNFIEAQFVDTPDTETLSKRRYDTLFTETARFSESDLQVISPLSVYTDEEITELLQQNEIYDEDYFEEDFDEEFSDEDL